MSRPQLTADIPALALRRAQAAAACAVSLEVFDAQIRPYVPAKRLGGVVVYPTAGLERFLTDSTAMADELANH